LYRKIGWAVDEVASEGDDIVKRILIDGVKLLVEGVVSTYDSGILREFL